MSSTILTIATRNAHKAQEIAAMLPPHFTVRTLADYPELPDVEEDTAGDAPEAVVPGDG